MNFAEFLRVRKSQKNFPTGKEHFEELGGQEKLGFSLRNFYLIEAGKQKPTETLLAVLFEKVPARDRKALVLAYFRSVFGDDSAADPLLTYLNQYLAPAVEAKSESIWDKKPYRMYSDEQLDYLNENLDAMRLHQKVLVLDKVAKRDAQVSPAKLRQMQKLALVRVEGDTIYPHHSVCKLPNYENSNPRSVARATAFILNQAELYIAKEGAPDQEITYAIQLVTPDVAKLVLEQTRTFKQWVQSLASADTTPGHVPLLHVSYAKKLRQEDL